MFHWFEYASISKFDSIRTFPILCKVHREVDFFKYRFEEDFEDFHGVLKAREDLEATQTPEPEVQNPRKMSKSCGFSVSHLH